MKNRFKPVIMTTNQQSIPLQLFSIFFMLLSCLMSFGQWGIIEDIQVSNESVDGIEIRITPPKGNSIEKNLQRGDTIFSGSKLIVPSRTKIKIVSINKNERTIRGYIEKIYTASINNEDQYIIDNLNNNGSVLNKVSTEVNGGVTATSSGKTVALRTRATEFLVISNGKDLTFELISGKVAINRRVKVELNEDLTINSSEKREVFINETQNLTLKNPKFIYNSDSLLVKSLNTEDEDEKFFKNQLSKQKKTFLQAGPLSKAAFKLLNKNADSLGLQAFENSILNGEIRRDFFIQSALLLSEAYLRNGNKEISSSWLYAAFYFAKQEINNNQELYDHYIKNNENNAAKAFGSDLVIANEYYAWAYTVKLKLTGCLEAADQNPRKWRKYATDLRNKLNKL